MCLHAKASEGEKERKRHWAYKSEQRPILRAGCCARSRAFSRKDLERNRKKKGQNIRRARRKTRICIHLLYMYARARAALALAIDWPRFATTVVDARFIDRLAILSLTFFHIPPSFFRSFSLSLSLPHLLLFPSPHVQLAARARLNET